MLPAKSSKRRLWPWLLALLLLPFLLVLAAPFFLPWDLIRGRAEEAASKALGRRLSIEKVEVSLFSGVHVRNIRLANGPRDRGFSEEPLFSNGEAELKLELLSLLRGRPRISLKLKQPRLLLETSAKGVSNLEGLGSSTAAPASQAADGKSGVPPVELSSLELEDAEFVLRDRGENSQTALRGLDLKLRGLSLDGSASTHLELKAQALALGKRLPLKLDSDFRLDLGRQALALDALKLNGPGLEAEAQGSLRGFSAVDLDLHLDLAASLGELLELLPSRGRASAALAQLRGKAEGKLTLKTVLKARKLRPSDALAALGAKASFRLRDGVLRKTDMQERMARAIPLASAQALLRSDLRFAEASAELELAGGRLELKNFKLGSGPDWRAGAQFVEAEGWMRFGGALDFKVVPHFNPAQLGLQGEVARAFADEKGWPSFDAIRYSGSSLDAAKADFSGGLKKAAGKALQNRLEPLKQKASEALQEKAGDLLKQLPGFLNR